MSISLRRSLEEAAHSWKVGFAFDLPPNLRTGRWRERGGAGLRQLSGDSRLLLKDVDEIKTVCRTFPSPQPEHEELVKRLLPTANR